MASEAIETVSHNGYTIKIYQDTDPESPREWDNLGTMVCNHRRYKLGDEQGTIDDVPEDSICLPLYLYDHSGITMSTEPFACQWDSGQVGVIYVTHDKVREEFSCKRISAKIKARVLACLKGEVKTYDQFLAGDVYGFVIEDEEGNHVDSCWGFYGLEDCTQEAKSNVPDNAAIGTHSI